MARNPDITPELLLEHADFVRGLARSLLANEAEAEDVVQETWIRALQTGPRRTEALGSWLRSVAHNLALKTLRSRERRRRREHNVAQAEAQPSTASLVERETSLKRVLAGVLDLPEAYREVVMLRYYDDLPPR